MVTELDDWIGNHIKLVRFSRPSGQLVAGLKGVLHGKQHEIQHQSNAGEPSTLNA
jgi:hypothetical protein